MGNKKAITIRPSKISDLEYLFLFQLDAEAGYPAALMPEDPSDKNAYMKKYEGLLVNPTVNMQTIWMNNNIVGSISKFIMAGDAEITYWIDKPFWGEGIATTAFKAFLTIENTRPISGRVAFDNLGSQKVLEKCGFVKIGADKGFANARKTEIQEFIYERTK